MKRYMYRNRTLFAMSCLVTTFLTTVGPVSRSVAATASGAQPVKGHVAVRHTGSHVAGKAATVAKPQAVAASATPEVIHVGVDRTARDGGGGMMRLETAPHTVQSIGKQFIDMKSPTSTALDLIKTLPSVSVSTPDTSGMQGGSIISRSLTDADMGLLVDGAPAASASYMAEDVDSEDLESVNVTPGSSAIDIPTTSAAAGVMDERTHTPGHKFGGLMDFSYGTNNLSREFIRLESGDIGKTGIRSYFSFSNTHARSWMGSGINSRKHIDFGVQKDWQNGSFAKFFISWNYEDFTIDNYSNAAEFYKYKHTGQGYGRSADASSNDYWGNNIDHWNQIFLTAPVHIVLPAKFKFDITPYFNFGQGWDGEPDGTAKAGQYTYATGTAVPAGTNLTSYFLEDYAMQVGVTTKLGYDIDRHNHAYIGYWYQNEDYLTHFPVSAQMANGRNPSPNNIDFQLSSATTGLRSFSGNDAGFEVHSIFIGDSAKYLHDKLTVDAGFKYVMTNYWYKSFASTGAVSGRYGENNTTPLPHLSIGYTFNDHNQIYVNAEGDFRQPSPSAIANSGAAGGLPKNQYSIKEELGYRYHDKYIIVDLSLFNYNITNRLLSTYIGGGQSGVVNAGNQTARGVDAMISTRPFHGFSPYASVEYLNARMDSNIRAEDIYGNASYFATKGHEAPQAPHVMANFGLTYQKYGFFGNATLHYTGPQSVTLAGDERIPGYVTDTLSLGYHFKPFLYAKSPTFRLNFTNLTGAIVRTGVRGIGTSNGSVRLMNGNMSAAGSGASFYVEPRFSMTGTISTSF
ncbi:TonB-dependent receptor [Komagataeibacter rhaeticus]|uniref:TonB-dependent receptor n=1 Tax=Komagataeibacter rhaeticus TaxID=215221 RepID=UPI001ED91FA0